MNSTHSPAMLSYSPRTPAPSVAHLSRPSDKSLLIGIAAGTTTAAGLQRHCACSCCWHSQWHQAGPCLAREWRRLLAPPVSSLSTGWRALERAVTSSSSSASSSFSCFLFQLLRCCCCLCCGGVTCHLRVCHRWQPLLLCFLPAVAVAAFIRLLIPHLLHLLLLLLLPPMCCRWWMIITISFQRGTMHATRAHFPVGIRAMIRPI